MKLRPYQNEAVQAVYQYLREQNDNPVVVLPTGCHAAGHPILMFDGTVRPVEEVRKGELVMGADSQPRRVLQLCRGVDEMFLITPHRGEPFIVNGDHVLSLVCTNEGKSYPAARRGGEIDNVTVRDYLSRSRAWRHLRKLYRVPVEFTIPQDLPIPPYILGLLLGDGSLRNTVELTTTDEEIADCWDQYARCIGTKTVLRNYGGRTPIYRLTGNSGQNNLVIQILEELGLADCKSGNKFIPLSYLTASRADRLLLLAGLMDTDGSRHRSGFEITTKSRELAADIVYLCRGLGLSASNHPKFGTCQTGASGWYFRVQINGDCHLVPCRLPRKQPPKRRQKKSVLRTGFKIEACGRDEYFGFLLDGDHLYVDGQFVVHHNSGKTPVLSTICKDAVTRWQGRVLVLSHVKELLAQAEDKLRLICPKLEVGVYSAGLGRRDTIQPVIVAGIQSVYRRAGEFGSFDLVIIDEVHTVPPEGEGMYRTFLGDLKEINPQLRVIGLTATPYRLSSGLICQPDHFLNAVCYEIGIRELMRDGYLCPLIGKAGVVRADTDSLHSRGGEFIASEVEDLMDQVDLVDTACEEIVELTRSRQSVLIFASGVAHGQHIQRVLQEQHGLECGFVCGETPDQDRTQILDAFQQGQLKYLANVNVLTTGFDCPRIDCVVLLRPTMSPGFLVQMVGRGFRLHPSKSNCLILDFGGNLLRHGPVDMIQGTKTKGSAGGTAPAKECPECHLVMATGYACCPECGYEFPPPERGTHAGQASREGVLSGEVTETAYEVRDIRYCSHTKMGGDEDAPKSLRVEYLVGLDYWEAEWICLEHSGYARQKAEAWWQARSPDPVPDSVERALELIAGGALATTHQITVRSVAGEQFNCIIDYELGAPPEPLAVSEHDDWDDYYIPF